ncbi:MULTISPECIES: L,D-transpeptidase [unclassified Devosia]|uniref:L,D-transpeptidase n=1 Tax=unclassified Devosia TaxID=196773 RepID=UPI000868B3FA|nr:MULTISPECIES: L,D-transpeptidase [unclassified Devosia]MBN9360742.1 L,D-transpeptidase [Devosia sp.]ODS87931.1 MAG: hypothetical protein ABS47_11145 [Devosia sp. SCN 66-27]OJX22706.1 MAG: L,D-transpeptidase [Devosia sp. 66-14]
MSNPFRRLRSSLISAAPSRRIFLLGAAALAAGGSATASAGQDREAMRASLSEARRYYAATHDGPFVIEAVDLKKLRPAFYRQVVDYETKEAPGTVVVDTHSRFLYLTGKAGTALRYGVGIGREGFSWSGRGEILIKKIWPTWTPPAEMIRRQPELASYGSGMSPGPDNPLGARALYIYRGGVDTLYRLHGSSDVTSIGQAVSSGCVRLLQQDIIDLYERVPEHTPIVVL